MKKGIRIFLMIVVVVLVFAGVQWVPNIVNQMQEKKDLGQAVITKDSTSKKNIGMQLSYAEKMDILRGTSDGKIGPYDQYVYRFSFENQQEISMDDRGTLYTQKGGYTMTGDFSGVLDLLNGWF